MSFSIKTIIRAFLAPDHQLRCPRAVWNYALDELHLRSAGHHEAGAFFLGEEEEGVRVVKAVVFYDDLDSNAYDTGVCVLHGDAFARLWAICRERRLSVVADVHLHGGSAGQSESDRTNPMVARSGHIAMIVPNFARRPVRVKSLGIWRYQGSHRWTDFSGAAADRFFYAGFWS